MAIKNPKRINYAIDYSPYAAKNQTAADGLAALYDTVEEINQAMASVQDPRAVAKAIDQRSKTALSKARTRLQQTRMQSAKHGEEIGTAIKKRNVEFDAEIRQFVRSSKSPVNTIRKMIAAGEEVVGAIFRAPSSLSGISDQEYTDLYTYAKTIFTPDLAKKEQDADHAADLLDRAIQKFEGESIRLTKLISTSDEAIAQSLVKEPAQ